LQLCNELIMFALIYVIFYFIPLLQDNSISNDKSCRSYL